MTWAQAHRVVGIVDVATIAAAELRVERVFSRAVDAGLRVALLRGRGASAEAIRAVDWDALCEDAQARGVTLLCHETLFGVPRLREACWGVHLGASALRDASDAAAMRDAPGAAAVLWSPTSALQPIGFSTHGAAELVEAERRDASWAFVSPFAPSRSKPGYGPVLGVPGVAELAAASSLPVFALAGVYASSIKGLGASGAAGVAVMGMLQDAPALDALRRLFDVMEEEPWLPQTPWS